MAHTWQPNQRGRVLFLYLSVSTCLKGLNEITVIQPDHRTEEIQMVFTSSPVYITFTLFHSFSFLDFLILLPPFFTCPAPFISPYFPCSSPFTPSTYLYINTLKKKRSSAVGYIGKRVDSGFWFGDFVF